MRHLFSVFTVLVTLTVSLTASLTARAQEASPVASPGIQLVETSVMVAGRALHLACVGTGAETVLFEEGGPDPLGGASLVAQVGPNVATALGARFCAYDRAGTGRSDPDPRSVRTLREAAADLHAVLASPNLGCPCVVVGESLGGAIALVALAENAAGFGGLVLLDAPYPDYLKQFLALAPAGSPEAEYAKDPSLRGDNPERLDLITGFRQVTEPTAPVAIPVVVVTHGAGSPPPCQDNACSAGYPVGKLESDWQAGEVALARALRGHLVVAEGTGHSIANENPGLVVSLTAEVIAAMRDPGSWATPEPLTEASTGR